ncbi:MAG: DUF4124 domain-containing protein [Magnetococcales bacterium]|nr:DUF4124 domain-containing protein [Magnetococcales bacterium]
MKLIHKLMLMGLLIAFGLPFVMFGPGGGPLLKPPPVVQEIQNMDVSMPDVGGMADKLRAALPGGEEEGAAGGDALRDAPRDGASQAPAMSANKVYRWKDAKGTWQFTSYPPPQGVEHKSIRMDASQNVVPAYTGPAGKAEGAQGGMAEGGAGQMMPGVMSGSSGAEKAGMADVMKLYSPENIQRTIQQAQDVQGLVNQRKADMDRQLENIGR